MQKAVAGWLRLVLIFVMGSAVVVGVSALAISGGLQVVNGVAFLAEHGESVTVHIESESDFYRSGKQEQGSGYYTDSSGSRHAVTLPGDLRPGQVVDARVAVVSSVPPPLFLFSDFQIFRERNEAVTGIGLGFFMIVVAIVIGFLAYVFGSVVIEVDLGWGRSETDQSGW